MIASWRSKALLWVFGAGSVCFGCPKTKASQPNYSTEQEWIISDVSSSIVALTRYAKTREIEPQPEVQVQTRSKPKEAPPRFGLKHLSSGAALELTVEDYVWSPELYAPWVKNLLGSQQPQEAKRKALHPALTELTAQVLEQENQRLSEAITAAPMAPLLHEQAALLLGAFSLRETGAHFFYDVRHQLSRMSAHLALARALRAGAPPSVDGQLARALLLTLAGRTADAVKLLDSLEPPANSPTSAWSRAIRVRATHDWRLLTAPGATLLEQLVHFRQLQRNFSRGGAKALERYGQLKSAPEPDWGRILRKNPSIEICNRFVKSEPELEEARAVYALHFEVKSPKQRDLIAALNTQPVHGGAYKRKGRPYLAVIDWGIWAAFEQRELLADAYTAARCSYDLYGKGAFEKRWKKDAVILSSLQLAPFVALWVDEHGDNKPLILAAADVAKRAPAAVTAYNWSILFKQAKTMNVPRFGRWFRPLLPHGITLFENPRFYRPTGWVQDRDISGLVQLNPYNHDLITYDLQNKHGVVPPPDKLLSAFNGLEEYDMSAMWQVVKASRKHGAKDYKARASKLCALAPRRCKTLAEWAIQEQEPDRAAELYRTYVQKTRDRVHISNYVGWLTEYELKKGNKQEALRLARIAAQAYSYSGLSLYGSVLERLGKPKEAEVVFKRIQERYRSLAPLTAFFIRQQKAKDRGLRRRAKEGIRTMFPKGLETWKAVDRSKPPKDGCIVETISHEARKANLRRGSIIVGMDGYRIQNEAQYMTILALSPDPELKLLFWNDREYKESAARPPRRRFGINLGDYKAP